MIYATFAAQAMANADATERLREQSAALERQLRSQRELLRITESILTTLDTREVLERITERLGRLIACDNVAIEVVDPATGLLTPLTARGIHAADYLEPWEPGRDRRSRPGSSSTTSRSSSATSATIARVNHFRDAGRRPMDGSLIVVPLRGRAGRPACSRSSGSGVGQRVHARGVRARQAVRRAGVDRAAERRDPPAVEIRARTDDLTGLLNHGTFEDWLERSVARRRRRSA